MNEQEVRDMLKKIHTKELMSIYNRARKVNGGQLHYNSGYDFTCNHGQQFPVRWIKEELDTREHIPNKKERKSIRQQKAKLAHS